jgi:hypothetical protein
MYEGGSNLPNFYGTKIVMQRPKSSRTSESATSGRSILMWHRPSL